MRIGLAYAKAKLRLRYQRDALKIIQLAKQRACCRLSMDGSLSAAPKVVEVDVRCAPLSVYDFFFDRLAGVCREIKPS